MNLGKLGTLGKGNWVQAYIFTGFPSPTPAAQAEMKYFSFQFYLGIVMK